MPVMMMMIMMCCRWVLSSRAVLCCADLGQLSSFGNSAPLQSFLTSIQNYQIPTSLDAVSCHLHAAHAYPAAGLFQGASPAVPAAYSASNQIAALGLHGRWR